MPYAIIIVNDINDDDIFVDMFRQLMSLTTTNLWKCFVRCCYGHFHQLGTDTFVPIVFCMSWQRNIEPFVCEN